MSRWYHVRWSRSDDVILRLLLGLGIVFVGLGMLVALAWTASLLPASGGTVPDSITVRVPEGASGPRPDAATADEDYEAAPTGTMRLVFHDPTLLERCLLAAPGLLGGAAALVVLAALWPLARSLRAGDPFVPANVRRVYTVALTVLAGSVLVPLVRMLCEGNLWSRALGGDGFLFTLGVPGGNTLSLTHVFAGLVLVALAEVFRGGARLREDTRGLV
ncbi:MULTISPECIES: DUF2975 domain-containing protein [unclassified Nocardiopsis]|uniref:DUF2975 domain-containing protein n=1 Tax=unclassified Nocardiopsis TaxID=2649073 RepID=UPI00135BFABF|nr:MULTISPECIES: DUF2975 domain-containing protein [unclassified Nocardiopsis]